MQVNKPLHGWSNHLSHPGDNPPGKSPETEVLLGDPRGECEGSGGCIELDTLSLLPEHCEGAPSPQPRVTMRENPEVLGCGEDSHQSRARIRSKRSCIGHRAGRKPRQHC